MRAVRLGHVNVESAFYRKRRYSELSLFLCAWIVLWLVSAGVLCHSEKEDNWTYFVDLYFTYTSLTTIGYEDFFFPRAISAKSFSSSDLQSPGASCGGGSGVPLGQGSISTGSLVFHALRRVQHWPTICSSIDRIMSSWLSLPFQKALTHLPHRSSLQLLYSNQNEYSPHQRR